MATRKQTKSHKMFRMSFVGMSGSWLITAESREDAEKLAKIHADARCREFGISELTAMVLPA